MNTITRPIADWCRKNVGLSDIEYMTVQYGIELTLNSILKILLILLIGLLFGVWRYFALILLVFSSTRTFAGGRHCNTHMGCFLSMLGICLCGMFFHSYIPVLPPIPRYILSVVILLVIIVFTPLNSLVNPIEEKYIVRKRVGSLLMAIIWIVIMNYFSRISYCILIPLTIEALSILPRKGVVKDAKPQEKTCQENC